MHSFLYLYIDKINLQCPYCKKEEDVFINKIHLSFLKIKSSNANLHYVILECIS